MSSFNHRLLTREEAGMGFGGRTAEACGLCKGPYDERPRAVLFTAYDYVTGRAGRVSRSTRPVCREHAEKFALKHRCDLNAEMLGLKHYFIEAMKAFVVKSVPLDEEQTRAFILTWEEGKEPQHPMEAGVHQVCHQITADMARKDQAEQEQAHD